MSEKKKIVIASQEEVAEYSGQGDAAGNPSGKANPTGGQEGQAGGAAASAGTPAAETPSVDELRAQVDEYKDKYLRSVAELSNYRKRAEKDREDALRYANSNLVRSLLPVLDDLERVVTSGNEHPENTAAILDGVRMTIDSFKKALAQHSVMPIEAHGQPFDPAVHEAMMQQPSDQHDVPTVLQVFQEGYKLLDRVIRPARVIVSKPAEEKSAGQ